MEPYRMKIKKFLQKVGEWLKVNGECIYDTLPWRVYGEGPTLVPEGTFTDTDRSDLLQKISVIRLKIIASMQSL